MDDQIVFIMADLGRFTAGEVVALALNLDANLRDNPPVGTPVDTGWAAANWMPSVGQPAFIEAFEKDPQPAQVVARAGEARNGLNEILRWKDGMGPIYNTNNVPYIQPLNDGHSPQSPPGFVQAALEKAVRDTYASAGGRRTRSSRGKGRTR